MLSRLAIATLLLATPIAAAQAATTSATLQGTGLSIDTPCARHVTITPDPTLHGTAAIEVTADHQEEIDRLILQSHDTVELRTRPAGCWQEDNHESATMDISIRVPAGFPIAIDESGAGNYAVGPVGGPLDLDVSGAADITAAAAAKLAIDISGAGSITVTQAQGPANIDISGHGRVSIAQGTLPALTANLSGAGALAVTAGSVGKLTVDDSGAGSVRIGATVGDAELDISGVGAVHLARVTGSLNKDVSGVGSVTVGN